MIETFAITHRDLQGQTKIHTVRCSALASHPDLIAQDYAVAAVLREHGYSGEIVSVEPVTEPAPEPTPEPETSHGVKVGDLFEMSWGYDQTNVNFFEVTAVTPKGVKVREIASEMIAEGVIGGRVKPLRGEFLSESAWCGGYRSNNPETFRRIKHGGFKFKGGYYASPTTEDESHYCSFYH